MSDRGIDNPTADKKRLTALHVFIGSGIGSFCLTVLTKKIPNTKKKKIISSFILMSDVIDKNYSFGILDSVFCFFEILNSGKVRIKTTYS